MPNILVILFGKFSFQVLKIKTKKKNLVFKKSYTRETVHAFHGKLNFILVSENGPALHFLGLFPKN